MFLFCQANQPVPEFLANEAAISTDSENGADHFAGTDIRTADSVCLKTIFLFIYIFITGFWPSMSVCELLLDW